MGMRWVRRGFFSPSTPTNITMENSRNARAHRCMSGWKYDHASLRTPAADPQKYSPRSATAPK